MQPLRGTLANSTDRRGTRVIAYALPLALAGQSQEAWGRSASTLAQRKRWRVHTVLNWLISCGSRRDAYRRRQNWLCPASAEHLHARASLTMALIPRPRTASRPLTARHTSPALTMPPALTKPVSALVRSPTQKPKRENACGRHVLLLAWRFLFSASPEFPTMVEHNLRGCRPRRVWRLNFFTPAVVADSPATFSRAGGEGRGALANGASALPRYLTSTPWPCSGAPLHHTGLPTPEVGTALPRLLARRTDDPTIGAVSTRSKG